MIRRSFGQLERDQFLTYVRSASATTEDPCLHWGFGPVMELRVDDSAKNYLFSREKVPFHWDGAFFEVPGVLVFHCVRAPANGAGGETLFCDAEKLYQAIPREKRNRWSKAQITYRTEKVAHYGGEVTLPLFGTHPHKRTPVVRFAEAVTTNKNPVTTKISGVGSRDATEIHEYFTQQIYSPEFCYVHQWQEGDLLLADNHSLLHGRRAFLKESPRHIWRIQLK